MKYRDFYLGSLGAVVFLSVYPIYMGVATLGSYWQNGYILAADYPKYIIPYTPICLSLIISVALLPLFFKFCRQYTQAVVSLWGIGLFLIFESGLEQIKVLEGAVEMPLESWQLSLCIATPEVLRSLGEPLYAANNPAFKIHFYLIAMLIILAVLNVISGFSKMLRNQDFSKKRPLVAQAVTVAIFIILCLIACFTAFYRNGTINISPLSALLMTVFFITFGLTAGIYVGTVFYGKSNLWAKILPALTASLTTFLMYIGELVLMDGILFKYGGGFFFKPLIGPFAAADLVIILASGGLAFHIMKFLESKDKEK
jgi:hypothetical protein